MKFVAIALFVVCSVLYAREVNPTFLWDATVDTTGRVITGSTDETSGYWYVLEDEWAGGSSRWIFPSDVKTDSTGDFFGPLTRAYGAIQGDFVIGQWLEESTPEDGQQPYIGIAFNPWDMDFQKVDISAWGGFCIEYFSSMDFVIRLYEDEECLQIYTSMKASDSLVTVNVAWDKFRFTLWGPNRRSTIEDALQYNSAVRLVFMGDPGTSGSFKLTKFGSYGSCDGSFVSTPKTYVIPSIQVSKISPSQYSISGLVSETSFQLFDLNGKVLKSGTLKNGGVVNAPTQPVILKLENGAQFLLK